MAASLKPKAFWPLTIAAGVNDSIDAVVGAVTVWKTIAAGVYLSLAELLAACGGPVSLATWTPQTIGTEVLNAVVWSGSQFVAVGYAGVVYSSPDGATWTPRTSGTAQDLFGIAWSGSGFVAAGRNGTILTSSNGISWSVATSGSAGLQAVTWSGSQFVIVGRGGTILTSPTGAVWTARASGTAYDLYGVAWSGSRFVAVGASGTVRVSTDGIGWSGGTSGTANFLNTVEWSGSRFVAVGGAGTILVSADGSTWSPKTSGTGSDLYGVTWTGAQYVVVGASGTILTSPDCDAWSAKTSGTAQYLWAVDQSGTAVVAVGAAATIDTAPDLVLTASASATGRVTLSSGSAFSLKFSTGAHAATSARYVLGFGAVDTASATSATGANQHECGWYARRPVASDTRTEYDRTVITGASLTGRRKTLVFGSPRESRSVALVWLDPYKTKIEFEGTAHLNEAIERLWRDGFTRFRYWRDATDEATYTDYSLDGSMLDKFAPAKEAGVDLYSYPLAVRRYVA